MTEFEKAELKQITINKMMKEPKKLTNGLITIGFNISKNKKHCCLIVAQPRRSDEIMIINEFYDDEADEVYKKLVGAKEND